MFSETLIMLFNKLFKSQDHPFNMKNAGEKTYAEWQFENGEKTLMHYFPEYSPQSFIKNMNILDMGCGAGGKSIYYLSIGAASVTGVDVVEHYRSEAENFAKEKGYSENFRFIVGDAGNLNFPDGSFDTIIMNDFFEHASDPKGILTEALRLAKAGGGIYINFPPYYHPFGAHLSDAINIPWVHLFFSDKALINVYKKIVSRLPDGKQRIKLRISVNDLENEYFSYINKMTVKKAREIFKELGISPEYISYTPLRLFLKPFCRIPFLREMFIKNVTCVIRK